MKYWRQSSEALLKTLPVFESPFYYKRTETNSLIAAIETKSETRFQTLSARIGILFVEPLLTPGCICYAQIIPTSNRAQGIYMIFPISRLRSAIHPWSGQIMSSISIDDAPAAFFYNKNSKKFRESAFYKATPSEAFEPSKPYLMTNKSEESVSYVRITTLYDLYVLEMCNRWVIGTYPSTTTLETCFLRPE